MPKLSRPGLVKQELSLYQQHCQRWQGGCGSVQCARANKRCFARGTIPCDILLCGEAPGISEDVLGLPFVGPAGKLLDKIVARALAGYTLTHAFTNVVCCLPREEDGGKASEPDVEQLTACQPRLEEFIAIARPRLLVSVGTYAQAALEQKYTHSVRLPDPRPAQVHITHPAAILRANLASQSLMVQRCVVTIRSAVEELTESKS